MRDLYCILSVSRRANTAGIRAAYRLQAKLSHPDLHAGDREAERQIQEINYAYKVLSDPEARAAYDLKLALSRMRAQRRWGAAATMALAAIILTMTTLSLTWRKDAGIIQLAGDDAKKQSSSSKDGNPVSETSAEGIAEDRSADRLAAHLDAASTGQARVPPAEARAELPRPANYELAIIPPSTFSSEQPVAQLSPPVPFQEVGPQRGLANAAPSPPAAIDASVGEISGGTARRDSHRNRAARETVQKKSGGRDNIIKSTRTTTEQSFEREPRLVSTSTTALRWPSADEPFVNMGVRGR
jgi:curved DNA-binding protein CbpA